MLNQFKLDEHLDSQAKFARAIQRKLRVRMVADTNKYSPIDYYMCSMVSKKIVGMAELKNRNFKSGTFPDLMIDSSKIIELKLRALFTDLPVYLCVRLLDKDLILKIDPNKFYKLEYSGRTADTRTELDLDAVQMIPFEEFEEIPQK